MEIILLLSSDHILMGACHLFLATELYFLHNTTGCFTTPGWPCITNGSSDLQEATCLHGMISQLEFNFYYYPIL